MKPFLLVLPVLLVWGCSPIKPEVEVSDGLPKNPDTPIFVTAARQKEECKQALRNAGFKIVDRMEDSERLLRATIGIDQDARACGTLNNVKFQMRFEGSTIAEVGGKGWTGACQPNILTEISRDLWRQLFGASGH